MVNYIQKSSNYFQKCYKNGKKKRVSREEFVKKKIKTGGGTWGNIAERESYVPPTETNIAQIQYNVEPNQYYNVGFNTVVASKFIARLFKVNSGGNKIVDKIISDLYIDIYNINNKNEANNKANNKIELIEMLRQYRLVYFYWKCLKTLWYMKIRAWILQSSEPYTNTRRSFFMHYFNIHYFVGSNVLALTFTQGYLLMDQLKSLSDEYGLKKNFKKIWDVPGGYSNDVVLFENDNTNSTRFNKMDKILKKNNIFVNGFDDG